MTAANAKGLVVVLLERLPPNARTDESDSLAQASLVESALRTLGYETARVHIDLDLGAAASSITSLAPDCVFNLAESVGRTGRFAHLPTGLLESLGIPFTGSHDAAMYVTSNKPLFKKMADLLGFPTPLAYSIEELRGGVEVEAGDYIVKSAFEEGSVGLDEDSVVTVKDTKELENAITSRLSRIGGAGFAERYIDGREFNLGLLSKHGGVVALPPAEIVFQDYPTSKRKVVGYTAKWDESSFEYKNTPRTFEFAKADERLLQDMKRMATACWAAFDLRGYARVDFRVDAAGSPWILEINANPCLSEDAGFMAACVHMGLSVRDVVERIVDAALERAPMQREVRP